MFNNNIIPQIQNMKYQINNIESQLDNLIIQIQNNGLPNIGLQINNISIQILNMGIQSLNIGKQIPYNNPMNNMNMDINLQNIITQINNIINPQMNMFGMQIPPMNNFSMGIPFNENQIKNEIKEESNVSKMEITFNASTGSKKVLLFDYGTTINEMLEKYLESFNRSDLINNKDKFVILHKGNRIDFEDKTKIEEFFEHKLNAEVTVYDMDGLLPSKNI